ncbi:hypothetical protein ABT039_22540 [Streptomyces lasiicapitis]|uniref:hypothetical protein n=1 Tax=Streptomyces lasiicapitis TaxID=1923961 RepID=UPI003332757F
MPEPTAPIPHEPQDEAPQSAPELLEELAHMYLRTVALPFPRHPATFGWQITAGTLAALAARLLHHVQSTDPAVAAEFARLHHGAYGDGPHPIAVGRWLEQNIAEPAGADLAQWSAEAKQAAKDAREYTNAPTAAGKLGVLLGDDALSLLISGLGASWKEWDQHGSTRRRCFLPGCTAEFDLVHAWSGEGDAQGKGWQSSTAVGFACPQHTDIFWTGENQHVPAWTSTGDDSAALECTCGWSTGTVEFRGHGITLYQVHALQVLRAAT